MMSTPNIDIEAERAALRNTGAQWGITARTARDPEQILALWTDDAKIFPPGMAAVDGKAAIRRFVAESMRIPGFSVTWVPDEVSVSEDGTLGYTTGTNTFTSLDASGQIVTSTGRHVTVWRNEHDGAWRCVIDIWNVGAS